MTNAQQATPRDHDQTPNPLHANPSRHVPTADRDDDRAEQRGAIRRQLLIVDENWW